MVIQGQVKRIYGLENGDIMHKVGTQYEDGDHSGEQLDPTHAVAGEVGTFWTWMREIH
jgi:hypothetical protein